MYVMPDVPLGKALRTDMPATGRSILRSGRKPATFTDLGRVSADYPLCLVLDGNGCAWTSDTYGYLIRVNMMRREFDMLTTRLPPPAGAIGLAASMSDAALGPSARTSECPMHVELPPASPTRLTM